ncbi:Asp-tRNA(Asn)/Glu-tRNA(Gln) amidotransferase subunit GatA [Patescibacteria group bacterium]|nr:Asp-tRNA(Asn)/Glu-tRNA(Gln) amidotransferase subunit GatA [Patescibacteria group bacterium]
MNLNELTVTEALEGLIEGKFSSEEITKACLERISQKDPEIKAFITVIEEAALEEARKADEKISKLGKKAFVDSPLLGIPYACKDNFCTKGVKTTAGSKVLENFISPYESTVTALLKDAGAILLGKTNMDAFAHGSSTEESDFFVTKNPWDVSRVPGGSSGGSAAAVIADMCLFAIGSETGGSIRGPASWCGVTGLKPSYGRVSRYGLIAMASSTDSPGPITKTAQDSALILEVLAGKDPYDATTSPLPTEKYSLELQSDIQRIKIGRPKQYFELDLQPDVLKATEDFLEFLRENGATIVDIDLMDPKYSIAVYTVLQRAEVSSNLGRLDGIRYGNDRTSFGFEAKKRIMLGAYTLSAGYYEAYYSKAQKVRTLIIEDFNRAFSQVDVIVGPTMPCVALGIGESSSNPMFGEMIDVLSEPSTIAGLCGITIPVGFSSSLPVGAQIIGNRFKEAQILQIANFYQQKTRFHLERPKK